MRELACAALIYLGAVSFVSVILVIYDKIASKRLPELRVRENAFLLLAAAGGAVGMLVSMLCVRHKTKHRGMMFFITVFAVATAALAGVLCNIMYTMK